MKKRIRLFAAALCAAMLFCVSACEKTPEQDIVVNKGESELQEKIESSTGEKLSADNYQDVKESFKSSTGEITYNIDASFDLADAEGAMALKVTPHFFTEAEAESIARALFGDAEIYEYSEELTKAELEEKILELEQTINDRDALLEYYGTEEQVDGMLSRVFYPRLEELKAEYETASDKVTKKLCDFKYYTDEHYKDSNWTGDGNLTIKAYAEVSDTPYFFWLSKREDTEYKLSSIFMFPYDFKNPMHENNYYQTTELTDEEISEAKELVQAFLDKTGMDDLKIKKVEKAGGDGRYAVRVTCAPTFGDLSLVSNADYWTFQSDPGKYGASEEQYADSYASTEIQFDVSKGAIMGLVYVSPMDAEVLNENVQLKDYDSIVDAVKTQLEVMWTRTRFLGMEYDISSSMYDDCTIDAEVNVTRIELNLIRTRVRDEPGSYYLLPAWVAYGSYTLHSVTVPNGRTGVLNDSEELPLFAINAVDGSVINTSQGY